MTDDDYMFLVIAILGLAIMAVWQFLAMRRLRKKVRQLETSMAGSATKSAQLEQSPVTPAHEKQMEELRNRVQVLERIATDRETSLAREIEELRDR